VINKLYSEQIEDLNIILANTSKESADIQEKYIWKLTKAKQLEISLKDQLYKLEERFKEEWEKYREASAFKAKFELENDSLKSQIPHLKKKIADYEEITEKQKKLIKTLENEITQH